MNILAQWPKAKKITMTGVVLSLSGFGLIFSSFPGYGFVLHVLGDVIIVFGILSYVFPEAEKSSQ